MQELAELPIEKLKPVIRAAIYARYSSEMQSPTSARDQIDRIGHLVKKGQAPTTLYADCKIEILPEWIQKDEAFSGKVAGRHGYQNILHGIRNKCFDILFVDDLSRLTRSLGNLLELYQLLKHHDIELVSISDRLSSADPNSRTFFTVKGMVADFGNEAHSERTKRGMEARARGLFSTGQKPYGFDSVATQKEKRKGKEVLSHFKLVINPEQAGVVRKIFELYSQGFGRSYIAKYLNTEKIKPPKVCSRGWKVGPLNRILNNEKYIGHWIFNKTLYSIDPDTGKRVQKPKPREEWIANQSEDLRIVPQDIWDKVQKRLAENLEMRRKRAPTREQQIFGNRNRVDNYGLLTGIIVCSECGSACALVSGRRGGYYGCIEAHRHATCNNKLLLRKSKAEKAIVDYLNENLASNPEVVRYATEKYNELIKVYMKRNPDRRREIETEMDRLTKEIGNLINFITSGSASDIGAVSEALKERESRKDKLGEELAVIGHSENRQLLVTPYLIKERLTEMVGQIVEKSSRYNGLLKELIEEPLVLSRNEEFFELKGRMNIGLALKGSRQCINALPSVQLSNPIGTLDRWGR